MNTRKNLERGLTAVLLTIAIPIFSENAMAQTLIEECQEINDSGSYLVANNLPGITGLRSGKCITIKEDYVTLDLGGHFIEGNKGGDGITDGGSKAKSVVIRNGIIRKFKDGIDLRKSLEVVIEDIHSVDNSQDGIVAGPGCRLSNNVASQNGSRGIVTTGQCALTDNVANFNDTVGLQVVGEGNSVIGNVADNNGTRGLQVRCPSNVIANTFHNNGIEGINFLNAGCNDFDNLVSP